MQCTALSFVSLACVVAMVAAYGTVATGGFSGYNSYYGYMPYSSNYGYTPMMPMQYGGRGGGFGMAGGSMGLGGGMSSRKWFSFQSIKQSIRLSNFFFRFVSVCIYF